MKMVFNVNDRPKFGQLIVFAIQQLLAIMAATIAVPAIVGNGMTASAALFGAGIGTIVYQLFTKFKSPVFLGSSFAFIGSMCAAFGGATAYVALGYLGLILGAIFAGLVYVAIAIAVKFAGVDWIDKIMPKSVIGATVAVIGLSLSGNAIGDLFKGSVMNGAATPAPVANPFIALLCGLITLVAIVVFSIYGKKMMKMIPFVLGILVGYVAATIFTVIGHLTGTETLLLIDFGKFANMAWMPEFTFVEAFKGLGDAANVDWGAFIVSIIVSYVPVAFVVFAEHLADHKNISSIIGDDLLKDPGLDRTLLGDGVGSMVGALFGGCPNTTYGESVGCVAISGNASVVTIFTAAIICIVSAFVAPFVTFLATIPSCVMGGVCVSLYGFIAVSGLKMLQQVDLSDNVNLFTVSAVLIAGVGNMKLVIGSVTITPVACALILGIIINFVTSFSKKAKKAQEAKEEQKQE